MSKINDDRTYYIFLDEVHNVEGWEKAVNSLRLRNTDIYIAGSNSNLLSSKLSALLAGMYVESAFILCPLQSSYISAKSEASDRKMSTVNLMHTSAGGFPVLSKGAFDHQTVRKIITDVNSSVILRDVVQRNKIRNVQLLQKIIAFVYDNVGNITIVKSISDHFKKENRTADYETIRSYIQYLEDALIIHKVQRYDVRDKKLLETLEKYYLAEHSLQYAVRDYNAKKYDRHTGEHRLSGAAAPRILCKRREI